MFKNIFQQFKFKLMAKQLRRPNGASGAKVGEKMNKVNEFLYDFTLKVMNPSVNESILEIGFGNGKFFSKLFSKAENLKVTGLDFSETMFKAATENNRSAIANGQLSLYLGNSDKLPFSNNSFDKIFCINVIYFWDEPQYHLQEIYRVLKPGGRFYATVRTKESMLKMPFTKYGFSFYDSCTWKELINNTNLIFIKEEPTDEPIVDFEGNKVLVQSICSVVGKSI